MPGTTPVYGFPYPEPTDLVADYPALGQQLAEDIEAVLPTVGGLSPIAPTSIANSGGTASTTANTTTFTGVTTLSLNGIFSATYDLYEIAYSLTSTSATNGLWARLRVSGTDATGSDYTFQEWYGDSSTAGAARVTSTSVFRIGYNNSSSNGNNGNIQVFNPFAAAYTRIQGTYSYLNGTSTALVGLSVVGNHTLATSYTGITFLLSGAGNMTGTVSVYGYKK